MSLAPDEKCYPTRVAAAMLLAIEHRGKDATGAAWVAPKSLSVYFQKENVTASKFVPSLNLEGARTVILHTRYATKGSPKVNGNNHPIVVPGMVGVHNGCLRNDDALFDMLGDQVERYAQVDSEAAFALLNAADKTPITERLSLLEGSAALAWLTVDDEGLSDRVLHLARVSSSPLWLGQTPKGSTLFGSTLGAVEAGAKAMGTTLVYRHQVKEGTYLTVHRGTVTGWHTIPHRALAAATQAETKAKATKAQALVAVPELRGFAHGITDLFDQAAEARQSGTWDRNWWAKRGRDGRK